MHRLDAVACEARELGIAWWRQSSARSSPPKRRRCPVPSHEKEFVMAEIGAVLVFLFLLLCIFLWMIAHPDANQNLNDSLRGWSLFEQWQR
jgi:hypothetical protein